MKDINIYDISNKSGVSIATVSRVLNNSPKVSQETRDKVLKVIEEMNYVPNALAQRLTRESKRTIGILYPDVSDVYMARSIFYVEQALSQADYFSFFSCTGYVLADKKARLKMMLSQKVDGLILIGSSYTETIAENHHYIIEAAKSVPVICINGMIEGNHVFNILCDDAQATYQATKALIKTGVKGRLLYLYNRESYSNRKKIQGFLTAMLEHNLPVFADSIRMCGDQVEAVLASIFEDGLHAPHVDGIVTSGDSLAVRVLKYLKTRDLVVPDDIQVIGYSNSGMGLYTTPELTSIDSRIQDISHEAVRVMLAVLKGEPAQAVTILPGEVLKRGTTKPSFLSETHQYSRKEA